MRHAYFFSLAGAALLLAASLQAEVGTTPPQADMRSKRASSPENIEGLYSTGSLDPADFISVGKHIDVSQGWTMYSFDLPAGAKRFAIRANSQATFLLQIDDVTYQPMPLELEIKGYNVWRNGERVTTEPVEALTYLDKDGKMGDTYRISPVFQVGEAVPGASLLISRSGVDSVSADTVRIYAVEGAIVVAGAQGSGISVYTVDGALYKSTEGLFSNVIPAAPGIYIVKAGNKVAKVVVK